MQTSKANGLRALLLSALLATGCGDSEEITQVVLEVTTDIAAPDIIDEIRATITNPTDGDTRIASAVLGFGQPGGPRTLAITHGGDVLEGYEVVLDGLSRGVVVVSREIRFDMTAGAIRRLRVSLDQECVGVPCTVGATCSVGVCVAPFIATVPLNGPTPDAGLGAL